MKLVNVDLYYPIIHIIDPEANKRYRKLFRLFTNGIPNVWSIWVNFGKAV